MKANGEATLERGAVKGGTEAGRGQMGKAEKKRKEGTHIEDKQ
jgi:hypothetical protein